MAGPLDEEYSDPIIIPFGLTIPDPRPRPRTGMSRLRRVVVVPANGWKEDRRAVTPYATSRADPLDVRPGQVLGLAMSDIPAKTGPGSSDKLPIIDAHFVKDGSKPRSRPPQQRETEPAP